MISTCIDLTEDDIFYGARRDGYACPIALALERATGRRWHVSRFRLTPLDKEGNMQIEKARGTSASVRRFLSQHDLNLPVSPFSFILLPERLECK